MEDFWCSQCEAYYDEFTKNPLNKLGTCVSCGTVLHATLSGYERIGEAFKLSSC